MSGWETTRLSKHFILLDFMADHDVYNCQQPLRFAEVWTEDHQALAESLCQNFLEPIIQAFGPISIADAFWPQPARSPKGHSSTRGITVHKWENGLAAVDIAANQFIDNLANKANASKEFVSAVYACPNIYSYLDRARFYLNTEFAGLVFNQNNSRISKKPTNAASPAQRLRAHHIRVGRSFCLLDFCRNAAALEAGQRMVPPVDKDTADYKPIAQEEVARACAALLDPLVARLGRVSVIRGIEAAGFASDAEVAAHHWDDPARPCRVKAVLPQGTETKEAKAMLDGQPGVEALEFWEHPSEASAFSLTFRPDQVSRPASPPRGLRPVYG